jgi:DNA-binding HxlR family transcriptional regulator
MDPCAESKMAESARGFVGHEDGSVAPIASVRDPLARTPFVMGNPVRRAILQELRGGPRAVGEIAAGLPVSRPAVSRRLRVLEDAGVVQAREEGRGTSTPSACTASPAAPWFICLPYPM